MRSNIHTTIPFSFPEKELVPEHTVVSQMQYFKYTMMSYCIWVHFAVCKPACFPGCLTRNPLNSRRYITSIEMQTDGRSLTADRSCDDYNQSIHQSHLSKIYSVIYNLKLNLLQSNNSRALWVDLSLVSLATSDLLYLQLITLRSAVIQITYFKFRATVSDGYMSKRVKVQGAMLLQSSMRQCLHTPCNSTYFLLLVCTISKKEKVCNS